MKGLLLAVALAAGSLGAGLAFRDDHYRLRQAFQAGDQAALDHRDSAYTSMTWVASSGDNYLQLRFFDKVEGGYCLHPSWSELRELAVSDPRLAHLVPSGPLTPSVAPSSSWPSAVPVPDPGTLANSAYVRFFPLGVLFNAPLMEAAGGDLAKATPNILIVGLGSGVGIAVLAHHCPQASITVVDIDQKVEDMVVDHIPLLRWLTTATTADGRPRLKLVAKDARQFVRFDAKRAVRPYDLIILDAYTAGSTIPSHLMTREFFAACAADLTPSGLLLGNIIGSYDGPKRQVLGGALRSMRAGNLPYVHNIPVLVGEAAGGFSKANDRNNITLASATAFDPRSAPAVWEHARAFTPWPELATGRYVSRQYILADHQNLRSAFVPAAPIDAAEPSLAGKLTRLPSTAGSPAFQERSHSDDRSLAEAAKRAVAAWVAGEGKAAGVTRIPLGWDDDDDINIWRFETDWVKAGREVIRVSLAAARDAATHGGEALVGPPEGPNRNDDAPSWMISDAPLFTDQRPNADILNR